MSDDGRCSITKVDKEKNGLVDVQTYHCRAEARQVGRAEAAAAAGLHFEVISNVCPARGLCALPRLSESRES